MIAIASGPPIRLTVLARARHGDVVAVQHESEGPHAGPCSSASKWPPESRTVAPQSSQVRCPWTAPARWNTRGVLVEMGVHDDLQVLELLEDPIDGRRADVGSATLDALRDLFGGQVTAAHRPRPRPTVRLATVTRLAAPRIAERISSTPGVDCGHRKHYVRGSRLQRAESRRSRAVPRSTIECTMSPAGTIEVIAPTACPAG